QEFNFKNCVQRIESDTRTARIVRLCIFSKTRPALSWAGQRLVTGDLLLSQGVAVRQCPAKHPPHPSMAGPAGAEANEPNENFVLEGNLVAPPHPADDAPPTHH